MDRIDIDAIYDKLGVIGKQPASLVWVTKEHYCNREKERWVQLAENEEKAVRKEPRISFPISQVDDKDKLLGFIWSLSKQDWVTREHIHQLIVEVLGNPCRVFSYRGAKVITCSKDL